MIQMKDGKEVEMSEKKSFVACGWKVFKKLSGFADALFALNVSVSVCVWVCCFHLKGLGLGSLVIMEKGIENYFIRASLDFRLLAFCLLA